MGLLKKPIQTTATTYQPVTSNAANYTGAQGTAANYNASQSNASDYNAANATAGQYTGAQGTAANYSANNGTSSNYTADQREVDEKQTVAGQMTGLLDKGGDYMKRAETKGLQLANSRGLLNTDFAVGAAHGSAMDAAMPIAQQDANTYANQSLTNQNASNEQRQYNATNDQGMTIQNMNANNAASQFNAGNEQQMTLENMNSQNNANEFNAGQTTQVNQGNQNAQNTASQYNASNSQQTALANQDANNRANEFNANASQQMTQANMDSQNEANRFSAGNEQQTNLANQSAQNRASEFNATTAFNEWSQESQQNHQLVMENLSTDSKERLIQVEMDYKRLIDNEKSGSQAYMQAIDAMGAALGNSSLSANQQQRAVDEITAQLGAFLNFNSVITGVEPTSPDITNQTSEHRKGQETKIADMSAQIKKLEAQIKKDAAKIKAGQTGNSSGGGQANSRND